MTRMRKARVTLIPPAEVYRDGALEVEKDGGFVYEPRFLREAVRRTGGAHEGPTLLLESVGPDGAVRRIQAVTLMVSADGSISLRHDQGVTPTFLEDPQSDKPKN